MKVNIFHLDFSISDHNVILCEFKNTILQKYSEALIVKRTKTNSNLLHDDLLSNPILIDMSQCTNAIYNSFINELLTRKNKFTTTSKIMLRTGEKPMKPWIDNELRNILKIKNVWYKKFKRAKRNEQSNYDIMKLKRECRFWSNKFSLMASNKKKIFMRNKLKSETGNPSGALSL